jgi:hypothetical protein
MAASLSTSCGFGVGEDWMSTWFWVICRWNAAVGTACSAIPDNRRAGAAPTLSGSLRSGCPSRWHLIDPTCPRRDTAGRTRNRRSSHQVMGHVISSPARSASAPRTLTCTIADLKDTISYSGYCATSNRRFVPPIPDPCSSTSIGRVRTYRIHSIGNH